MIDIHAQKKAPDTHFRGTRNGNSVKKLISIHGIKAITDKYSIFGQLSRRGYKVFPRVNIPYKRQDEKPGYYGGFIIKIYGSNNKNGIDAIQIEIGKDYRFNNEKQHKFVNDLANAIISFYKKYIKTDVEIDSQ